MKTSYQTRGTCSTRIDLDVTDGVIRDVSFQGGCDGNLKAIASLVRGMDAGEAAKRLQGIDCRGKGTSCGDQLSKAILQLLERQEDAPGEDQ